MPEAMDSVHRTGLVNVFWPHYRVIAICLSCGWWGHPTHVKGAQADALNHSVGR